ncbi:MAG TPA: chondroitinase-B domain-containing protein [Kofleriaceae bacterium]|nr:chondroitinase-B domain-containing protein [Kofleriaceae bacterium]
MVRAAIVPILLSAAAAHAGVVNVSTPAELTAAITSAQAGDEIVLASGTYALTGATCSAVGTAAQPIIVRSATPLGAKIEFDALEGFKVTGAHWHFEGLDVRGVCASDPNCEHAFHVMGAADGFVLRNSRVVDFNAQLKVNVSMIGSTYVMPNNGLVEYNEVGDTRGRNTSNPVTKLNIDTGNDWIVRGNYLHDAYKLQGDNTSYAAFMKSGGKRGLFERNLVICSRDTTGGTRIGLSFGGGGTAPQFCAPAYDINTPCSVEHDGGTMRNNIIVNCSDVGIYLNRGKDSHILFNTLIATSGVDFRFDTTSGEAVGNLLAGMIRARDLAMLSASGNTMNVAMTQFTSWYQAPLTGDLRPVGDITSLIGSAPMRTDVLDDYCAQLRPAGALTMGAIEHSVGTCDTTRPPMGTPVGPYGDDVPHGDDSPTNDPPGGGGGCCQAPGHPDGLPVLFVLIVLARRRRA